MTPALVAAVALSVAFHVTVFVWESFLWNTPRVRAAFGTTEQTAETTRVLAANQGYYNLFLALIAASGAAGVLVGHEAVGAALVIAGCGAMVGAALVLVATRRSAWKAAIAQGFAPLVAVVLAALIAG